MNNFTKYKWPLDIWQMFISINEQQKRGKMETRYHFLPVKLAKVLENYTGRV